jgi:hypothetical protein
MSSLHYPNEVAIKLPDSVVDRSKTLSISNMAENQQSDENLIKAVKNHLDSELFFLSFCIASLDCIILVSVNIRKYPTLSVRSTNKFEIASIPK